MAPPAPAQTAAEKKVVPKSATAGGNTKPQPKQVAPAKHWCFTHFPVDSSIVPRILEFFDRKQEWEWGFGEEICPTTGRQHLQGWISFDRKVRPMGLFTHILDGAHWEKSKGSRDANINYCCKEGKYYTNVVKKTEIVRKLIDVVGDHGAYPWQQEIIDLIQTEPDDRKIYWYWEPTGATGKSALIRHIKIMDEDRQVLCFSTGKGHDWACALAAHPDEDEPDPMLIRTILIDLPRTSEGFIPYNMLEQIKNGHVFSGKYKSKSIMFNYPHVIIFANFAPDIQEQTSLSKDRWVIKQL